MTIETPSERDYACLFCTGDQSKDLSAQCSSCGAAFNLASVFDGQVIQGYELKAYIARGYYGATYFATNRIGKEFALKWIPRRLYEAREKDFYAEVEKYRSLGALSNIAELIDAGEGVLAYDSGSIDVYFLVMEWVIGQSLTDFVKTEEFSATDLYSISLDIASAVARFETVNLWHNDLNSDNILIKRLTSEEQQTRRVDSQYIAKIVDTGSAVFRQLGMRSSLSDVSRLGRHIEAMQGALLRRAATLSKPDLYFVREIGKVVARLLDEDLSRGVTTAQETVDEIDALYGRRLTLDQDEEVTLSQPFAYLNANDFPNESYTNFLFSDKFPWLRDATTPDRQSLLITGPRGCGKTIVLRSMRLRTKLSRGIEEDTTDEIKRRLDADNVAGFFVSARIDIGNHCPLTRIPKWAEQPEMVNLYFNLLYLYEVADTLHFAREMSLIDIPKDFELKLCDLATKVLGLRSVSTVGSLLSAVSDDQRLILSGGYSRTVNPSATGPQFLTELCRVLKAGIPHFRRRTILFLLDDFSLPKIREQIQKSLLPTIWNTGGGYSFRVTAHSESVSTHDLNGVTYDPNREYSEINLGASYMNSLDLSNTADDVRECVDDILRRRFALNRTFRKDSLQDLLGDHCLDPIGETIRELHRSKKSRTLRYAGWVTVVKLCSGDISYILDILSRILRERPKRYPVRQSLQNREIRRYARNSIYRLQDLSETALNLYEIASNFGKFSLFKLTRGKVKGEDRPAEYLRLEVRLDGLGDEGREALADLLRYGVFIDGGYSTSSTGDPARRLIFRKLFTPVFPTTYNNRDTWPMSSSHFLQFVKDSKMYVKSKMSEEGIPPEQQEFELDSLMQGQD